MSVTIDPTVRLKASAKLADCVKECEDVPKGLKDIEPGSEIELCDLRWLHGRMKEKKSTHVVRFHELVASSEVLIPSPVFPPRDPALEARVQRLRREQENRDYDRMVKDLNAKGGIKQDEDAPIGKQSEGEKKSFVLTDFLFIFILG